ncbi:MAG TPA: PAS domain-containing protein [Rhizomicrobium sp.]
MPRVEFQPPAGEPPLLAEMRGYWMRKRNDHGFPGRKDIVPSDIKKWLPQILLAEPVNGGGDFRYRLVGSKLRESFPSEPTGKLMSDVLAPFGEETVKKTVEVYGSILTLREPLRIRGDGAWYGRTSRYFEALLTPLSDDGHAINMIFGTFDFLWDHTYALEHYRAIDQQVYTTAVSVLK